MAKFSVKKKKAVVAKRLRRRGLSGFGSEDPTEEARRARIKELADEHAASRAAAEAAHGQVWDTEELQRDFSVTGFMAPFVVVTRKSDGKVGSLEFQSRPRYYFNFQLDGMRGLGAFDLKSGDFWKGAAAGALAALVFKGVRS